MKRDGIRDRVFWWLAWRLPERLVYFALIRAWAHGTTGQWGNTVAPSLTCDEAARRWEAA